MAMSSTTMNWTAHRRSRAIPLRSWVVGMRSESPGSGLRYSPVVYHNIEEMAITNTTTRGPGRPRNEDADRKIIEATLHLLSTEGYDRPSIESVAAQAHVTGATVYRRYPTK